jgi:biopolymer transport protein ExbB
MQEFFHKVLDLWLAGGTLMIPLMALSLLIFASATQLWQFFGRREYRDIDEATWQSWVKSPEKSLGEVGEIIRYTQDEATDISDIQGRFSEVISSKLPPVQRQLMFMNVMVSAAPLLGLLGTVLGMIHTFEAISTGGNELTGAMANGISEALITTEVGLLIAIPGFFFTHVIKRKQHEYEAFLGKLESYTIQHFRMANVLPAL